MTATAKRIVAEGVNGRGLVLGKDSGENGHALNVAFARYLAKVCRQFLDAETHLPHRLRFAHGRVAGLVRQALTRDQRQMLACFASPTVGTPLQCLPLRPELAGFEDRIDTGAAEMMPHLLLEMGLRRLIPEGQSLLWEYGAPRLASLAVGGELVPPEGAAGLRFSASHITVVAGERELARMPFEREAGRRALADGSSGFRFERRYHRVGRATCLATIDHNPIAAFEAHPEKAGNHVDLGGHPVDEWVAVLGDCFELVETFLPGEFTEMASLLHEIVPVGYHEVRHLSASYREAVGTVYMTLHPNLMTMVEALVHEFQHNKINVSTHSVDYLRNGFHPLFKSPVRPDPRPLWGILLAVHAFLPVAEFYRRMRDGGHAFAGSPEFERRMGEIDAKNHEGMEMLRANAQWTEEGRAMFDELEELERRHLADHAARGQTIAPTSSHVG